MAQPPSKMGRASGFNRLPSFKGRVVISSWRGVPRVMVQPHRRKKKISAKQRAAMETFTEAALLAKLTSASQQAVAEEITKGTQYFARDVLYMAFYGRLCTLVLDTNRKVFSVAARNEVSGVLDALGQTPGDLLVRDASFWRALPKGEPGQVLAILQDGSVAWAAGGGGGGGVRVVSRRVVGSVQSGEGWPRYIEWNADTITDWDPDAGLGSHYTAIPADCSRFRVTAAVDLGNTTQTFGWYFTMYDQNDALLNEYAGAYGGLRASGMFSNLNFGFTTPWIPRGSITAVAVRLNANSSITPPFEDGTVLSIETD